MIRLSHVETSEEMAEDVKRLILSGKIGQSEIIEKFEHAFAEWLGVKHAIAVSSGTMADTIALAVLKQFYPGKTEVIVPALTFIAQINAVIYNGLKPVFYGMDYRSDLTVLVSNATLCAFPVHLIGKPVYWNWGGPLIEDACEALGSELSGQKCGTTSDMGTFSFFPSHTITTGEGGMIATNNEDYARFARRLRNHGKTDKDTFHFDVIGFNGKMTSLQAAIGLWMLKDIDNIIEKRRANYFALGGTEGQEQKISPHAFPVMCASEEKRDAMLKSLRAKGIECRNLFSCIPTQEKAYAHLGYKLGDFPVAEDIGRRGLYVPCHQGLTAEDIAKIKEVIREA